jgi:hypothetical protein
MFKILKTMYNLGKISASDVWLYADKGKITAVEAEMICGARPSEV